MALGALSSACTWWVGCAAGPGVDEGQIDTVGDITVSAIAPGVWLPGTLLVVDGASFLPDFGGPSRLRLRGSFDGAQVHISLGLGFVDYARMQGEWPGGLEAGLPAEAGHFEGEAFVEADSSLDGLRHRSAAVGLTVDVAAALSPRIDAIGSEVLFVNDPVVLQGDGFLLGGGEGQTVAVVQGCFTAQGQQSCLPVGPTEVAAAPLSPYDRSRAVFPFSPHIAGIAPGSFTGSVWVVNRHGPLALGVEQSSGELPLTASLMPPVVTTVQPAAASLGQYLLVAGAGFVGVPPGQTDSVPSLTTLELDGSFTPEGGAPAPLSLSLVPEFSSGQLVRYVLNEEDELGLSVDLRQTAGALSGTIRAVTKFGSDSVSGSTTAVTLALGHVKQVVWLRFLPAYVESLRHFGLRALDTRVRERVLAVVNRDYTGINMEFRTEPPDDFALYAEVEIGGPDPNGMGLLGYDNTPGKDDGNLRLYDKIGGVNALTQLDGYPGYGGVFVDSLFAFSQHPGQLATSFEGSDGLFDALFDPFRPDLDGQPASAAELGGVPVLGDATGCPAGDRPTELACAALVLGSLIGTTVSHELAHSLGLADPGGAGFHNHGDWPNALMDAGHDRSFRERGELDGQGPGVFCQPNYDYLRLILPSSVPDPLPFREDCY